MAWLKKPHRFSPNASVLGLLLGVSGCPAPETPSPLHCDTLAPAGSEHWDIEDLTHFYTMDVHPRFIRALNDGGCADCHLPGSTHPFVLWSADPARSFMTMWSEGRLDHTNETGLFAVLSPDAVPRMPLGSEPWPEEDRRVVEQLACAVAVSGQVPTDTCEGPPDPGLTPMRRLSNWQYGRTIADTTGHASALSDTLAPDELSHGFDAVGVAQSFSPSHLDRYLTAAGTIATETLFIPEPIDAFAEAEDLNGYAFAGGAPVEPSKGWGGPQSEGYWLFIRKSTGVDFGPIPIDYPGTYTLTVRARGHGGRDCRMMNEVCEVRDPYDLPELEVRVDGATVARVEWDSPFETFGDWETWSVDVPLEGPVTFSVGLGNASWGPDYQRDVELAIDWLSLTGPRADELPEADWSRIERFLICAPETSNCPEDTVTNILSTLWRRTPTADEVSRYLGLLDLVFPETGTFKDGVMLVLEAALSSPHFLFRPEPDLETTDTALSAEALATRLSYMVWGAPPDAPLRARAEDGSLQSEDVLLDELDRLMADPKAAALAEHFAAQWWQLAELDALSFTEAADPNFDAPLREAMKEELRLLFMYALDTDASLLDVLQRDTTWVNDRLAAHYGLPIPGTGDTFVEVSVEDAPRGGLLQSGAFLSLTSHPSKTSPTRRGKWLLQQMLCQPPADPPDSVETDVSAPETGEDATLREQLEAHRNDPECAACHAMMDPLGLAFEHFGPTGQWRTIDDFGGTVTPSVSLPTGQFLADHTDTISWIANEPAYGACITQNFATYALGRTPSSLDACAMDDIEAEFVAANHTLRGLLRAVVRSPLFQRARTDGGP